MNEQQKMEKLESILSDASIETELKGICTLEDLQNFFKSKGLDLSIDEIKEIKHAAIVAQKQDDELAPDELELVSGGVAAWAVFLFSYSILKDGAKHAWGFGKWLAESGL